MFSLAARVGEGYLGALQESFIPIPSPRHTYAKKLMAFWKKRPSDGIHIGRDIPSRTIAPLLSSMVIWEPVAGGQDYVIRHMGETLRARFGGYVVGSLMSALLSPELFTYHLDIYPQLVTDDQVEVLDVMQSHSGSTFLHYELVAFGAYSQNSSNPVIVVGVFYF